MCDDTRNKSFGLVLGAINEVHRHTNDTLDNIYIYIVPMFIRHE